MTEDSQPEESAAVRGARWIAVGFMLVGLLNYGYALLLTHLVGVSSYASFAAGQSLILWASNVATVSVPWVLAQSLARARSKADQGAAIQFSRLASVGSGVIAAAVVGAIADRFAGPLTALVIALSTFLIFLGTATAGYLQGQQRMRILSALYVGETVLKNLSGLILVSFVGLGATGALAAFGIGSIVMLVWWPKVPRGSGASWVSVMYNRALWRSTARIAGMQALVSLFVAVDVVLVELLPGNPAMAASYQASAAVSRIALFIASAVATAFFPSLSRRAIGGMLAARAVQMYMAVALPLSAVLATVPGILLSIVFPAQYSAMASLLKFTAVVGLAAGGISLLTALFQATDDSSCIPWLCAGLAGYVVALLGGWRLDGVPGLAAGAAFATTGTLALLGYRLTRREGRGLLAGIPFIEPSAVVVILFLLRAHFVLWIVAAIAVGLRAGWQFLHPGTSDKRRTLWPVAKLRRRVPRPASTLLTEATWQGKITSASEIELRRALVLARQNRVEGRFARAYPSQFTRILEDLRSGEELFTRNINEAISYLRRYGIHAVLIESGQRDDYIHESIDLIIPDQSWRAAMIVLATQFEYGTLKRFHSSRRAQFIPPAGPPLYLHNGLSWFGIPALSADRLLRYARKNEDGVLVPIAPDYLRICLGQALYQEPELDLCALLTLRDLMHADVIEFARAEAVTEGWGSSFDGALTTARRAIAYLDRGISFDFQVPLFAPSTSTVGVTHRADWPEAEKTQSFHWEPELSR